MKPEDFPFKVVDGIRLRRVPELPKSDAGEVTTSERHWACTMCAADTADDDGEMCSNLHCDDKIYVPEDKFTEYVVEFVRRRVS